MMLMRVSFVSVHSTYIYTQLLECLAGLYVLLQTNIKNTHNLIPKESYFLLQSKECKI